jgi:hypothetical protein
MVKIALCFLTYENLSKPYLWSSIIENNKEKLTVYIHNKIKFTDEKFKLHKYCIKNTIDTKWGDISLVRASILLFKEAFLNEDNDFFILLSDKCIPLYNFEFIYNTILEKKNNIISSEHENLNKYNLTNKEFLHFKHFNRQSQWMVLNRQTVKFFIENDFTNIFEKIFAPDEHYFISICNKFNITYKNDLITYVNWKDKSDEYNINRGSPKTYIELTKDMCNNIKKQSNNYLFIRKISKNCALDSYYDSIVNNYTTSDENIKCIEHLPKYKIKKDSLKYYMLIK